MTSTSPASSTRPTCTCACARRPSAARTTEGGARRGARRRGPRLGHVYVDLAIRETATVDADEAVDLSALAWPPVAGRGSSGSKRAARRGERGGRREPAAALVGTSLYLIATGARSARSPPTCRHWGRASRRRGRRRLAAGSPRLDRTKTTSASAGPARPPSSTLRGRRGGPGAARRRPVAADRRAARRTGSGGRQGRAARRPRCATGKAAARLEEAVHEEAAGARGSDAVRAQLSPRRPRPPIASSAGAPTVTAASATTAATACPTTS